MLHLRQPPPPQPPRRRKRDLYEDPSIFEHVDQQAIAVAESEQTSYTELVDQLTYGLITDLEKARYDRLKYFSSSHCRLSDKDKKTKSISDVSRSNFCLNHPPSSVLCFFFVCSGCYML